MFNRGENYVLPVMDLYPTSVLNDIKKALDGETKCTIQRVDISTFRQISIDKITLRKNPNSFSGFDYLLYHTVTGEYTRSWKKGLGRFVDQDFKTGENTEKYYILRYKDRNNNKMMAFIRFIYNDEIGDELQDMKNYGAITGELTTWVDVVNPSNNKDNNAESVEAGTFYVVMKVVPSVSSFEVADVIGYQSLIEKPTNKDANWIFESDPFDSEIRKEERKELESDIDPTSERTEDELF